MFSILSILERDLMAEKYPDLRKQQYLVEVHARYSPQRKFLVILEHNGIL